MKKILFPAIVVLLLVTTFYYLRNPLQTTVKIRNTTFIVDVAVTAKEKELGLGNRNSLAYDHGMLFVYDHKELFPFWMKNMRFPIDILWIEDKIIVDITKNVPIPENSTKKLPVYHPIVPVDTVLEVNAGITDRFNISVGDRIDINN